MRTSSFYEIKLALLTTHTLVSAFLCLLTGENSPMSSELPRISTLESGSAVLNRGVTGCYCPQQPESLHSRSLPQPRSSPAQEVGQVVQAENRQTDKRLIHSSPTWPDESSLPLTERFIYLHVDRDRIHFSAHRQAFVWH